MQLTNLRKSGGYAGEHFILSQVQGTYTPLSKIVGERNRFESRFNEQVVLHDAAVRKAAKIEELMTSERESRLKLTYEVREVKERMEIAIRQAVSSVLWFPVWLSAQRSAATVGRPL